jgi:LPXTG-motif cell wall-anchored protein
LGLAVSARRPGRPFAIVAWSIVIALTMSAVAGVTSAARAATAGDATLSGIVTRAVDGSPVAGVTVYADGDGGSAVAETDAAGRYRMEGLNEGSYTVEFSPPIVDDAPPELAHEYWRGVRSPDLATPVEVPSGGTVTGIDASLDATGSISGRVIRATTGAPVAGATVHFQPEDHTMGFSTTSRLDGTYTLAGVVPGRHYVEFWTEDERLLDLIWPDATERDDAEPVTVAAGADTRGIDVALPAAAVVAGTVRMSGEAWTGGGTVVLEPSRGAGTASTGVVSGDGAFRIGKVAPGRYLAAVQPTADAARAARQYFRLAAGPAGATALDLRAGRVRSGVDFDLREGVDISGTVTAEGELSLPVQVTAYRWDGSEWDAVARTTTWDDYSFAHPPGDVEGHFLPAGRYTVGFSSEGFCAEFHQNSPTLRTARSFRIPPARDATGIDAELTEDCPLTPLRAVTPEIVGDPVVGNTLRVEPGRWRPAPTTIRYQWTIDDEPIPGATSSRLVLTAEMESGKVAVVVTGIRAGYGDTTRTSPPVGPVAGARLPAIQLDVGRVARGGILHVAGSGFAPGDAVKLSLHSVPVRLATVRADRTGAFDARVVIPRGTDVGTHALVAELDRVEVARVAVTVFSAGLPQAGEAPPTGLLLGGLLVLLVGVTVLVVRRRRS